MENKDLSQAGSDEGFIVSEVKRYTIVGDDFEAVADATGKWVRHDAAQSELAALREELAKFDSAMRALACNLGVGGYNAETLTADELVGKVQWGIDHLLNVHEKRLTAAEQRNAELCKHLTQAHRFVEATYGMADSGILTAGKDKSTTWNIDESKAAIKPTESGESE